MAIGTIFTLLVIPAIYVLIAKQHAGEDARALGEVETNEPEPESDAEESEEATVTAFARGAILGDTGGK
jgi:hypothetical protein